MIGEVILKNKLFSGESINIEYKVEKDEYEGEKFVPDYDIECGIIYNEFIALNTHMTQKAHRRIDELESEIKKLKQIINSLQGVA